MANPPVMALRQLRLAVLAALNAANLGANIDSPGDWSTPPEKLPAILLRVSQEQKEPVSKGQVQFTTVSGVELEARVEATTAVDAQDAIEDLGARIERALFTNHDLIAMVQQVAWVKSSIDIRSEGKKHIGGIKMLIGFEMYEAFDPFDAQDPPPLTEIGLHVDLAAPFDAAGTYVNPPFPNAVSPAPRTSGPDGRDEGFLDIQLPQ